MKRNILTYQKEYQKAMILPYNLRKTQFELYFLLIHDHIPWTIKLINIIETKTTIKTLQLNESHRQLFYMSKNNLHLQQVSIDNKFDQK